MNEVNEFDQVMKSWDEALENETWIPPSVNIYETEDKFVLEAEMPGVVKDNLKIKYEEGYLVIMGRINHEEIMKRKFILKESEIGNYYRKFKLAESIDEMKIYAKLEDGILQIELPKHDQNLTRIIEID